MSTDKGQCTHEQWLLGFPLLVGVAWGSRRLSPLQPSSSTGLVDASLPLSLQIGVVIAWHANCGQRSR